MASSGPEDHLVWKRTTVRGHPAMYGVAGHGIPVLFLHGWGVGQQTYKRSLKRLAHLGCEVLAPALPGFGGTADLPGRDCTIAGYAAWAAEFLTAVGVTESAFVVGHSFGGGVAIKLAHDFPDRVRYLVLINSVGGSAWTSSGSAVRSMAERRRLPVVVLWGEQDKIIPRASFDALCKAIGSEGEVVSGNHSWLLADPDAFGEVMTNVMEVAKLAKSMEEDPNSLQ